jgi:hypothetical protein
VTNDIEQLENGIHNLMLHIHELLIGKGFTDKAARCELVKVLVRELWKDVNKDDPEIQYILKPACSPAMLLISKQKDEELFKKFNDFYYKEVQ